MLRYEESGLNITVPLPKECGYTGYSVFCKYTYNRADNNYTLAMWLKYKDIEDLHKIDEQIISGTKETIRKDICRIIEQASLSGYFDKYIKRFKYYCKCFDYGDEYFAEM